MVALERIAPAQGGDEADAPRQRSISAYDAGMGDPLRFDAERLRILIERHHLYTGSARAKDILDNWGVALTRFVKVMPTDYAKRLSAAQIAGLAAFIVLSILGVPFAAALAIIVFFADLIPLVGATLGAVLVAIVTLFTDFPTATIVWAIFSIVYQQLENTFIQPQIQRRAVDVHPFIVLVSVLFGATLLGIIGALVAIPVAASVQIGIREWWRYRHDQSVNQLVQLTPLERVNERIHDITELVRGHLQDFLHIYGITLNDVKVLIRPKDERMRELISLRAFGLSELDAVRYYVAMKMAERGLVSAPNMAARKMITIMTTTAIIESLATA